MSQENNAKNSKLRKINPFPPLARLLVKEGITADQVTDLGMYFVFAGSALKAIPPEIFPQQTISLISLGLIGGGESADALDGLVAETAGTVSNEGAMKDFKSDRKQELAMAISRIITAKYRKDIWGVVAAMLSGFTSLGPGLYRAHLESLRHQPPEAGIGTRLTRAVLGAISTAYSEDPFFGLTIQPVIDSFSTIASIITTIDRYKKWHDVKLGKLVEREEDTNIKLAELKVKELNKFIPISGLILGICGLFGIISSLKTNKKFKL